MRARVTLFDVAAKTGGLLTVLVGLYGLILLPFKKSLFFTYMIESLFVYDKNKP